MLVTNVGAASGDYEVLRVTAFNCLFATVRAGPGNTAVQETAAHAFTRPRRRVRALAGNASTHIDEHWLVPVASEAENCVETV